MWTVVIFLKDDSIEAVPLKWLIGSTENMCYWPPRGMNTKSLIINCLDPSDIWEVYEVRFPNSKKKTFDNYLKARSACNALAEDSEIPTDEGSMIRRKRKKNQFESSSEEEEDENDDISSRKRISLPPKNLPEPIRKIDTKSFTPRAEEKTLPALGVSSQVNTPNSRNICTETLASTSSTTTIDSRVLRQVVLINNKLDNISKDILLLLEKAERSAGTGIGDDDEFSFNFPLKDELELDNFGKFLDQRENYVKFVHYVSSLGGTTNWDATRRIMERCLVDEVIIGYSWLGTKHKKAFGSLKIAKAMIEGMRKISTLKSQSEASLEGTIKSWLRHAKERIHKKKRLQ